MTISIRQATGRFGLFVLLLCLLAPALPASEEAPAGAEPPQRVLFVGNSFTYFNNSLHGHFRMLVSNGDPTPDPALFIKAMTISGERLASHEGGLAQMLAQYDWEVVILQGHSREAVEAEKRPGLEAAAEKLAGMVRGHGARPVLFMTWAYSDQPEMTPALVSAYTELGARLDVMVVPVGLAFADALAADPGLVLHHPDTVHPSLAGSYLAACVFYSALYGRSPEGNAYTAGLDPERALQLQRSAWRSVSAYYYDQ